MDLTPPQIFYLMVLLLRAAAQQAGVYFSPIDAAWEQAVPDGTRSVPVATTIGDNATIRSGLQCINISDSEEEIVEPVGQDGTTQGGTGMTETPAPFGPTSRHIHHRDPTQDVNDHRAPALRMPAQRDAGGEIYVR